jgi:hypothetical protein
MRISDKFTMQKFSFLFILFLSFGAQAQSLEQYLSSEMATFEEKEKFCVDEFNKSMKDLLKNDSNNLIAKAFSLASLKLSYRQLSDGEEKKTLENYLKKKIKELELSDNNQFKQKVKELYENNGESKDLSEINELIDGLDDKNYFPKAKRLSNKEGSVLMLALSMFDQCNDGDLCIDKSDAAVTWLMGELHEKAQENRIGSSKSNLMHLSVRIAHTSGVLNNTIPHTPAELSEEISNLEHDVKTVIHNHKKAFFEDYELCKVLFEDSKCLQETVHKGFDNSISGIIKDLKKQSAIEVSDKRLTLKFADQVVVNLENSLKVKRPPPPPKPEESSALKNFFDKIEIKSLSDDGPQYCGGENYSPRTESIHAFGFDLSRIKYLAGGKQNTNLHKVNRHSKTENKIKRLLEPLKINTPAVKVMTFMKTFILNYKHGRTTVCCNDSVDWRKNYGFTLSFYGGIEIKMGYNAAFLSYDLAGIGILGGLGLNLGAGYTSPPVDCKDRDHCLTGKVIPTVYGGGYVDALDGWIGGELKISWRPYVALRFCLLDQIQARSEDKFAVGKGDYKVGSIWLNGTFQIGWLTTYNYFKPIYVNDEDNTFDFDVLP